MRFLLLFGLCAGLAQPQGPVSVTGAVKEPVTFQAPAPVTLMEAIERAGGLTPEAGPVILVFKTRTGPAGGSASLIQRVSIQALIDNTGADAGLRLSGGEEVQVPEAGSVFVAGRVNRPGAYPVEDGVATSVLRVLVLAQGLSPLAGRKAYLYRRQDSGRGHAIPIEISRIVERKAPDTPLVANDVLYVTDNRSRRLGTALVEELLLFGVTPAPADLASGQ
jgi:polysaccharide export outer membrane protein